MNFTQPCWWITLFMLPVLFNKQYNNIHPERSGEPVQTAQLVFLYHVGYLPPKACCTSGNLSGGFVARCKCFVVDLPKGSMVAMCYRSKKKKKSFLVSWRWGKNHLGSFSWEYTAREQYISQPSHDQLLPRVLREWQGRWYIGKLYVTQ